MSSLSALLRQRARTDGARLALSFKERGVWQHLDWTRVERATSALRGALAEAGFGSGAVLFVSSQVSAATVLTVLAALSLGGTVSALDELGRTRERRPGWAFARNTVELVRLLEPGSAGALNGILLDDRQGAPPAPTAVALLSYSALVSTEPSAIAPVSTRERCVLEFSLTRDSEAKQLLTSWLTQGFALGVPEEAQSIERDAGELGVSLRIAPARSWDAWADALRTRFAAPGSRKRRFVEWALAVSAKSGARARLTRALSTWAVVGPLRRTLRLRHWRRAVSLGAEPSPETAFLLAGLGVRLEPAQSEDVLALNDAFEVSRDTGASNPSINEFAPQSA